MDLSELVKQSVIDATNAYAVANGIEPPLLTDPITRKAIHAYTSNAGPDANAWVELERMARKSRAVDLLLLQMRTVAETIDAHFPATAKELYRTIVYVENLK